jgi:hypothetical protein
VPLPDQGEADHRLVIVHADTGRVPAAGGRAGHQVRAGCELEVPVFRRHVFEAEDVPVAPRGLQDLSMDPNRYDSAAERGDGQAALSLALDLAAPPFAPRLATCRRSESDHERSPGDKAWASGIDVTLGAKDGSVELLPR